MPALLPPHVVTLLPLLLATPVPLPLYMVPPPLLPLHLPTPTLLPPHLATPTLQHLHLETPTLQPLRLATTVLLPLHLAQPPHLPLPLPGGRPLATRRLAAAPGCCCERLSRGRSEVPCVLCGGLVRDLWDCCEELLVAGRHGEPSE